jgi:hypothetical protein
MPGIDVSSGEGRELTIPSGEDWISFFCYIAIYCVLLDKLGKYGRLMLGAKEVSDYLGVEKNRGATKRA